jgi:hypothetical protein
MLRVGAAPSLPVDPPAQTPAPPGAQNPPVIVETTTPKTPGTVTFQQLLSPNGIVVPLTCTTDCTVDAILQILLKDYKNLTAANKLITIGKGSIKLTAGKKGKLRIKLTKQARKKLKIALAAAHISVKRKIKLNLVLQSKYKSGKKKTIRRKIILKG